MRSIMVLNPKGGCGKSTITTNLASYFASAGKTVVIADFDPQGSSLAWLGARPKSRPEILGVAAWKELVKHPKNTDVIIMDVPAGLHGKELTAMIRRAQTVIIPVLPSPIDIRAAAQFIHELLAVGKVSRDEVKLAVTANRVREHTVVYHTLERFLNSLDIPFIATLRDTQNYIRAAERGVGIFEMGPSMVEPDLEQWTPLIKWISSKRSLPKK